MCLGFSLLGRNAVHVEILSGRSPHVFDQVDGVPFTTHAVPRLDGAGLEDLDRILRGASKESPVVVDLPAMRPRGAPFVRPGVHVLVPFREGCLDHEAAANDLLDIMEDWPPDAIEAAPAFALFPSGPPVDLGYEGYLTAFSGLGLDCGKAHPLPIVPSGVRRMSPEALRLLTGGSDFAANAEAEHAAVNAVFGVLGWAERIRKD